VDIRGKLGEVRSEIRVKIELKKSRHGWKGVHERAGSMDRTAQRVQTALRKPSQEPLWEGMWV